jgi:hypothetical protein
MKHIDRMHQGIINQDNDISSVVNFDTEKQTRIFLFIPNIQKLCIGYMLEVSNILDQNIKRHNPLM